jgi:anion-transporting  ArsA/GET3 family ATPase
MSGGSIAELLRRHRAIVCCGAGGVGKTTVSASLAVSAARAGLRVVVITVDPSRRLAETLGVERNMPAPTELAADRLRAIGVEPPGSLAAWMLDPQAVCDGVVNTVSSGGQRLQMLGNTLYQRLSTLIAGMHEYTAIEALHAFIRDQRYDLVVLDTPPSRNALRFLEAPARATAFLDPRILGYFIPRQDSVMHRVSSRVMTKVLDLGLGREKREELQQFLVLFESVLRHLSRNQEEMRRFFTSPEVSFLLVTSPAQAAVEEADHFDRRARALGLPIGGYVLNQSLGPVIDRHPPGDEPLSVDGAVALRALHKLDLLAADEERIAVRHRAVAASLHDRLGERVPLWVLPRLTRREADLHALVTLADLLGESASPLPAAARSGVVLEVPLGGDGAARDDVSGSVRLG